MQTPSSDDRPQPSRKIPDKATFDEVRQLELQEIQTRRKYALGRNDDLDTISNRLVGVALSGGGIRSGAFSLGLLDMLRRRGLMRYVDFLSTASGGSYAGAYLSSDALRESAQSDSSAEDRSAHAKGNGSLAPTDDALGGRTAAADHANAKARQPASAAASKVSERMLRFIYGGRYLQRTWAFFNRYVIGLLLIWMVILSGLVAATSFVAWAFRWLDLPTARDWLAALGCEGDIWPAFFPSIVIFMTWIVVWLISYFKYGSKARGVYARVVFGLLIYSVLVATAILIGAGELNRNVPAHSKDQTTDFVQSVLKYLLFSVVGASFIPYLSPKALVRSGTNPQTTVEKYGFWIATRALVYGAPFLLVAYFAREDISGFNETRDSSLRVSEVRDWGTAYAPLFQRIENEVDKGLEPGMTLSKSSIDRKGESTLRTVGSELAGLDLTFNEYYALLLSNRKKTDEDEKHIDEHTYGAKSEWMPSWQRLWYLTTYLGSRVLGESEEADTSNPAHQIAKTRKEIRESQRRIVHGVNKQLHDPLFCEKIAEAMERSKDATEETKALNSLIEKARRLDRFETVVPGENPRTSSLSSETTSPRKTRNEISLTSIERCSPPITITA